MAGAATLCAVFLPDHGVAALPHFLGKCRTIFNTIRFKYYPKGSITKRM